MGDRDIPVSYDTSGVPVPIDENEGSYFSQKVSDYFYNKKQVIPINDEFTESDIVDYGLVKQGDNINISTTTRLIKYLKAFVHVITDNKVASINTDISNKLDKSDYVVDNSLKMDSLNPVQNRIVTSALNGKADNTLATVSKNGLMSYADKKLLSNTEDLVIVFKDNSIRHYKIIRDEP